MLLKFQYVIAQPVTLNFGGSVMWYCKGKSLAAGRAAGYKIADAGCSRDPRKTMCTLSYFGTIV